MLQQNSNPYTPVELRFWLNQVLLRAPKPDMGVLAASEFFSWHQVISWIKAFDTCVTEGGQQ